MVNAIKTDRKSYLISMNILRKILLILAGIILLSFGMGVLIAFINDMFGSVFWWFMLIALVVLSVVYLVRYEIRSKKDMVRKRSQYMEFGMLIFKDHINDFEVFYNAFLATESNVTSQRVLPIEVMQDFADKKGLSLMVDWRGEEDTGEIEIFINSHIDKILEWTNTQKLRAQHSKKETHDGRFIIKLFKAIDADLKEIHKKILFFDLGNDAYYFIVTDEAIFHTVTKIESKDFMESINYKRGYTECFRLKNTHPLFFTRIGRSGI